MKISRRLDHTWKIFLKRTIAAQLHLFGFIIALVGFWFLLRQIKADDHASYIACFIFGATALAVFGISSIYHFLHDGFQISSQLEHLFEKLDHFSIYSFIAGSYTAILINSLSAKWQMPMIVIIWVGSLFGILYTIFRSRLPIWMQSRGVYTSLFVLLGFVFLIRAGEVFNHLSTLQLFLLLGEVVAYSVGALVYALKRPKLFPGVFGFHELWHLSVVFGFVCHYALILQFYI